jgi:FkbM family methyltransferase
MTEFQSKFAEMKDLYMTGTTRKTLEALKIMLNSRPIICYGLGYFGGVIVKYFKEQGLNVTCFCDSKKRGVDSETGLPIISPQELGEQYSNANIVISVANPNNEDSVRNTLKSLGIDSEQIFSFKDVYCFIKKSRVEPVSLSLEQVEKILDGFEWAYEFFHDENSKKIILEIVRGYLFNSTFDYKPPKDAYFPPEYIFSEKEVFVDGGLYIGDTTEEFIRRVNGKYKRIVGFDIDESNLKSARVNLGKYENIEICAKGLWSEETSLHAELGILAGSNINQNAEDIVSLTTIKDYFAYSSDMPTYIKLDVEKSEKQALLGAKDIITKYSPKLAVCVYHYPEEVFEITKLLYEMNPNYRFFLEHYSPYVWETVLYAY